MRRILLLTLAAALALPAAAQNLTRQQRTAIGAELTRIVREEVAAPTVRIESSSVTSRNITLKANINLSYYPFRRDNIPRLYAAVRSVLPAELRSRNIQLYTDGRTIESLIPLPLRSEAAQARAVRFTNRSGRPLVERVSAPRTPDRGLAGRHIALWQSHGLYFDREEACWKWQRARVWQTVEDLYTQSYVLPFLVPMLENAGATVLLPRERDPRPEEVIVDNDGALSCGTYSETGRWSRGRGAGFACLRDIYTDGQNPFDEGTFRTAPTATEPAAAATAEWRPQIPAAGEYAVYVSYRTLDDSADDALYTVHHRGGQTSFRVNQTMGGGTWIYLGTFDFEAGCSGRGAVTLSSLSANRGRTVSADAVKFGGGRGNIARAPSSGDENPEDQPYTGGEKTDPEGRPNTGGENHDAEFQPLASGYPRYAEGARYWLQWAGMPPEVYTPQEGADDYKDDYMSRAHWVNYMAGGSERLPETPGLGIPLDMALAFHSDSGLKDSTQIVGTLGIFFTREGDGTFGGGASRYLSRDLTDLVMSSIVRDVRYLYEPQWVRRGMWNRSYFEARVPGVPTMLLELLSHHNLADMSYGLDPSFRFDVSRAVYKGILRHLAAQYGMEYAVQPLPVEGFCAEFAGDDGLLLRWSPVRDPLESSAAPDAYVLYTRVGDGAFDNGRVVGDTSCLVQQSPDTIYSYRITALNRGGESFPSETLAACRVSGERGTVMVINGFERVSAPLCRIEGNEGGGFFAGEDSGVPYIRETGWCGAQYEFSRSAPFENNDNAGFGASGREWEGRTIAGNSFDYPRLHGTSIVRAGYSFVSASARAVERGSVNLGDYAYADLILGKQQAVTLGHGARGTRFETFRAPMRRAIERFVARGGALLVSGSRVTGDAAERNDRATLDFLRRTLHCSRSATHATAAGRVSVAENRFGLLRRDYGFATQPNGSVYCVETPEAIAPEGEGAATVMRYDSGHSAAVAFSNGEYKSCVLAFPFETVTDPGQRDVLMKSVLDFFEPAKR